MNTYHQGEVIRLSWITTENGAAVDPAVVRLFVDSESGETAWNKLYGTDAEVIKDSAGHYHANFPIPKNGAISAGRYAYRWEGTGAHQAADEEFFMVHNSEHYG